jgi:hypothetical protein
MPAPSELPRYRYRFLSAGRVPLAGFPSSRGVSGMPHRSRLGAGLAHSPSCGHRPIEASDVGRNRQITLPDCVHTIAELGL